ncbi:serine hydrolase domain-containing protein [uncultured Croceitalea sp.]|uniref:serine hydrolase domain-containing protein n=1 Tax=uncultured Croceitalea sp. TaxID=1798908 RepID=UPI003305C028
MTNIKSVLIDRPLLALILLLLFNCPLAKSQDFESMDSDLLKIITKHNVPGITYSIVTPKTTYSSGAGKISINGSEEIKGDTRIRVGSITKTFIAIGLLQLQERGLLSLDDRLEDIIPEVSIENRWSNSPLSIRHLLEHTSGLSEFNFNEIYSDDKNLSALDVINRTPTSLKVWVEPGSYFQYSNSGYLLAGYILERYSEQPFETYLKNHILIPLGMKNSTFESFYSKNPQPQHHFYTNSHISNSPYKEIMNRWAGSLSTTSEDMAKFVRFLSHREKNIGILKKSSFHELETPMTSIASKNGIKTGYALGIMKNVFGNLLISGNRGGTHDLHARYFYSPKTKTGFFFSMNISNGACGHEINRYLSETVFPENTIKLPKENQPLTPERLNEVQGFYQSKKSRMRILTGVDKLLSGIKVFKVNDSLFLKENGRQTPILSVDGKRFFNARNSTPHIFMGQKNGSHYLVETNDGGGFYYKTSHFAHRLRQIFVFGAIAISLITGLFFLLKIIIGSLKKDLKSLKEYWPYAILSALLVVLFLILTSVGRHEIEKLGSLNLMTATLFLISVLYPLLTVFSVINASIVMKNKVTLKYSVITCLNCGSAIVITSFILVYNYFAIILW